VLVDCTIRLSIWKIYSGTHHSKEERCSLRSNIHPCTRFLQIIISNAANKNNVVTIFDVLNRGKSQLNLL